MSWLPTLKWFSCDTLTLLRDPTKRASVLSLFCYSLLPVTHLPKESTHCSMSNNQWMKVRWSVKLSIISKFVMTAPTLRNDFRLWLNVQSKEYWAQDWTLRNPVVKLLLRRDPTIDTYSLALSDKFEENHWRALPDMPNMSCTRARRMLWYNVSNAAGKSSKVKTQTWPSPVLPRRQFVTSRRAAVESPHCDGTVIRLEVITEIVGQ